MKPLLPLLALMLTLAACGVEESDAIGGPAGDSTATPPPACADVWVAGQDLPEDYDACITETNEMVTAEAEECEDGSVLVTHEERFWATAGETIVDTGEVTDGAAAEGGLTADPAYGEASEACAS